MFHVNILGLQYSIEPNVTIAFCNFKYFTFIRDPNWTRREIMWTAELDVEKQQFKQLQIKIAHTVWYAWDYSVKTSSSKNT